MKMKKMNIIGRDRLCAFPFVGAIAMLCGTAFGVNTNTWISGATDWSAAASYVENRTLSAGDVVVIPSGVTATVSVVSTEAANTEGSSFDVFSKLSRVLTEDATSALAIDVAEGASVTNGCWIIGKTGGKGTIIKRGLGMAELGANDYTYAYNLDIHVEEGTLALPQELQSGVHWLRPESDGGRRGVARHRRGCRERFRLAQRPDFRL